eukprot:2163904-Pleurochrysis_carterae.AAC.1
MAVLVAHNVGPQRSGELVLGRDEAHVADALVHVEEGRPVPVARELGRLEWVDQIRAGHLSTALRDDALAWWCMDARRIGRERSVIGQVVRLSVCERG